MERKLENCEERIHEMSREGGWRSTEKRSSDKLLHKGSVNLKNKNKIDPYLENLSKSKQIIIINRHKEGSKVFKDKG